MSSEIKSWRASNYVFVGAVYRRSNGAEISSSNPARFQNSLNGCHKPGEYSNGVNKNDAAWGQNSPC